MRIYHSNKNKGFILDRKQTSKLKALVQNQQHCTFSSKTHVLLDKQQFSCLFHRRQGSLLVFSNDSPYTYQMKTVQIPCIGNSKLKNYPQHNYKMAKTSWSEWRSSKYRHNTNYMYFRTQYSTKTCTTPSQCQTAAWSSSFLTLPIFFHTSVTTTWS